MIKIYGKNCVYAAIHAKSKLETVFVCEDILRKDNNIINLSFIVLTSFFKTKLCE